MAETQEIIQRESPELEALKIGLIEQAKALTGTPPTGGLPTLEAAGIYPLQAQAATIAQGGVGAYQPFITAGQEAIGRGQEALTAGEASLQAAQLRGQEGIGAYDPSTVGQFFDPFQQAVIEQNERDIARQGQIQQNALLAKAGGMGAFGGRAAIQSAEIGRNVLDQQARMAAQLRSQGFQQSQQQAMNAFEQARRRDLQLAQLQGQLGQTQGQFGAQQGKFGTQLGALGELQTNLTGKDAALLAALGKEQRGISQQQLDAARATGLQNIYEPYQRLGFFSDILRGAPSTQQTLSVATAPEPSLLNQIAGGGIAGLNLASAANKAGII